MYRKARVERQAAEPRLTRRALLSGLAAGVVAPGLRAAPVSTGNAVIIEYPLDPSTAGWPIDITAGPDGALWFTWSHGVGRITVSGQITSWWFPLVSPGDIVTGPDGNLWFTQTAGGIARITPAGSKKSWSTPGDGLPFGIGRGPGDTLWYTEYHESKPSRIGRIRFPVEFTDWELPFGHVPGTIGLGPDGNMWFVTGRSPAVGRIRPDGRITIFPIARERVSTDGVVAGADGNVWFTAGAGSVQSVVARVTPQGQISEFPLVPGPTSGSRITAAPDGHVWTAHGGPTNSLVRVSYGGALTYYPIPTPQAAPLGICVGADGNIWFTESFASKIGRLILSTTPVELMRFTAE